MNTFFSKIKSFIFNSIISPVCKKIINFYLSKFEGRFVLTNGPFTWDSHGVVTRTSKNWFFNHKFKEAYEEWWSEIERFKLTQTKRTNL